VAELEQQRYAAVTVDLKLPGQDGIALIRALRAQLHHARCARRRGLGFGRRRASAVQRPDPDRIGLAGKTHRRKPAGAGRAARHCGRDRSPPVILHVEDDPDIQRIAATIAQDFATFVFATRCRKRVTGCGSSASTWSCWTSDLPEGSGWDLLEDIEALDGRRRW
jgi:hypothetical protein